MYCTTVYMHAQQTMRKRLMMFKEGKVIRPTCMGVNGNKLERRKID